MPVFPLHGAHVPHRKYTSPTTAARLPSPQTVTLPMSMHIGAPATPIVAVGDSVEVGQPIAEQAGRIGAPIHASVSGTVKTIAPIQMSDGRYVTAVTIESDGKMTPWSGLQPPEIRTAADLVAAVKMSGIVGLGGAGFPTAVKLDAGDPCRAEYLLVNGAECEPYITSDSYTMIVRADEVVAGIRLVCDTLGIGKAVIGIEKNKPAAIAAMKRATANDDRVSVKVLPSTYPQGGEKMLIYHATGRTVPEGKLPLDAGCIVMNCTTLASVANYVATGMPLVEKCVTVDGAAIAHPQNVIAPIGTPIADLLNFVGTVTEPEKILYGGPMMGICVANTAAPIMKTTNAITALDGAEAHEPRLTACIRCGACINHCPMRLDPVAIARAYAQKDGEQLDRLKIQLCIECGCCSFVCPTGQPIVQRNRLAKAVRKTYIDKKEGKA